MAFSNRLPTILCAALVALGILPGCDSARDWWNRNNPPPVTPIAPPAKPAPQVYAMPQARATMTDALIFALSMNFTTAPQVIFDTRDAHLWLIYGDLLHNGVITAGMPDQGAANACRLVSRRSDAGEWNITLSSTDGKKIFLNKTLKIKE